MNNDYGTVGSPGDQNHPPGGEIPSETAADQAAERAAGQAADQAAEKAVQATDQEADQEACADVLDDESAELLVRFFDRYDRHFEELLRFLSRKQERVMADDLVWLENSLPEEERLVMLGNSLEQQRIEHMQDCGVADFTANELLAVFPEKQFGQLRRALESMDAAIYYIRETNNAILDLIEKKLEAQAQYIAEMSGDPLTPKAVSGTISTYGPDGKKIKKNLLPAEDIGKV
jgi:hypothetical protein